MQIQLEAGKYYRTRDGRKAYCIGVNKLDDAPENIIVSFNEYIGDCECYTVDGRYYNNNHKTGWDIIDEWTEE